MFRPILMSLASITLLTLTACGPNKATPTDSRTSHAAVKKLVPGATLANFNRIQLTIKPNDYASTIEQVRALLGKPTRIVRTVTNDYSQPLKTYRWEHPDTSLAGAVISVSFHDDIAVAKAYQGAELQPNTQITTKALDHLTVGTSYRQVLATLGTPNAVSSLATASQNTQTITYNNVQAHSQAQVTLTFHQHQLVDTTRTAI